MLKAKIDELKRELIGFGTLVEDMISRSIKGLLQKDKALLLEVIDQQEPATNDLEIHIDKLCTAIIAQHQPVARDLRTTLMIYKMNSDLERMGDHASNIADSGLYLTSHAPVKPLVDIPKMAEETIRNISDSIGAFVNEDAPLAQNVCERDHVIDELHVKIFHELVAFMTSDPTTIERSLYLIRIANNLERIADLSTNICEDVIFMVEGRVIKHHRG